MVWNVSKDTAITLPPTTITIITQEVTGACKAAPNTRNIKNTHTYKHAKTCKNASTCTVTAYCSTATPYRSSAYYPFYVAEFKFPQQSRRQKSTQYSDDGKQRQRLRQRQRQRGIQFQLCCSVYVSICRMFCCQLYCVLNRELRCCCCDVLCFFHHKEQEQQQQQQRQQ